MLMLGRQKMFDYYDYVNGLTEAKLVTEIEKLNKRLFKTNATSPVYTQLLNMIDILNNDGKYQKWHTVYGVDKNTNKCIKVHIQPYLRVRRKK